MTWHFSKASRSFLRPDKGKCWGRCHQWLCGLLEVQRSFIRGRTLGHAVLFMCFKSTIVVISWKGQAAVEVLLTLFPPFPPPSPVVNKWACVPPQHHPSHLYYWIRISGHPPTSTVDFFPLISIPCMSLHSLPQNKSPSWLWQCCCDERSIDFWMVAVWLLHTGESSFLLAGGTRARLILIALLYSER